MGKRFLLGAIVAGALLAPVCAHAQNTCFNPFSFDLQSIQFAPNLNLSESGAVVEIVISDLSDPSAGQTIRLPNSRGLLRLDADNALTFYSPIRVPNGKFTRIEVNVISAPSYASEETLNIIFDNLDRLLDAATEIAFKEQPLLKFVSSAAMSTISDRAKSELRDGMIVGSANVTAEETAALGAIPSLDNNSFIINVHNNCP